MDSDDEFDTAVSQTLNLTGKIVAAYVSNNPIPVTDLPNMMRSVHSTLGGLMVNVETASTGKAPVVPIKKSITLDYIICLEDGKRLKMLKRYLRTQYQMTPEDYRKKWGLPSDYPMVAPNYSERRSEFAKKNGLGQGQVSRRRRRQAVK